ncbi:SDR family oxidoreductase [Leucobacter sp. UCMA 4100]|uniref:SDR family NAD(P)-dependent oxidoreductase n=1 Tax=Leucobacter sp. UCMA 4100 TaxID=2810534 RepID=UPI0022EA3337|nr:SDR family oxidoreductase [Leucobacter sp. UCMA 4100]MDA3146468.1 SDR family oxidoreductase [Leucobacter sp. UCMA 4100]
MNPVVFVTGIAGGMGAAIGERMRRAGWAVAGYDRAEHSLADVHFSGDVTDSESLVAAIDETEAQLGPIAGLVCAAGHYESTAFTEVTDEQMSTMLRVHLGGFATASQAVLGRMIKHGGGSIVAITSELAIGGGPRDSHYSAAKGAITGAMKSLAAEVASTGVRVNAVAPGPTNTALLATDSPWREPEYLKTLPSGALTEPEEVAACVQFLLESATFMIGETLHPNSGAVI